MNEQPSLSPEQAADRSGALYAEYKSLQDTFTSSDHTASKNAERIIQDEETIATTSDKDVIATRTHIIEGNLQDLEASAIIAYKAKAELENNNVEAVTLARRNVDALHEAALASAKLHGIDIVEPTNQD